MIIVTGANGQLGRAIAELLLERVPPGQIGVSVRNPEKARGLEERGIRVRRGDFEDAASLAHAFEGASRVLVVSADSIGEEAVRQHRTAIDVAKAAGAYTDTEVVDKIGVGTKCRTEIWLCTRVEF